MNLEVPDIGNRKWYETDIEIESIGIRNTLIQGVPLENVKSSM